jgi:protein gp37
MSTGIEWTDETWNPVTGCHKVSPGCDHCYAETLHERFNGKGSFSTITLHPDRLDKPLHWRRPRMVFVNSMSDLFHKDIPDDYIADVFGVMAANYEWDMPTHTFQVLTKRHGRMRSLLSSADFRFAVAASAARRSENGDSVHDAIAYGHWPLPNVWLGVSTEDQRWANVRVPALLDTPATVRFVSAEPLLGPIQFGHDLTGLDWVIVGGESGNGARPMNPDWVRTIRDDCKHNDVAFFFKQWGGRSAKANGKTIDSREHTAWPERVLS